MDDYLTASDFAAACEVRYWDGLYAEELLKRFFPVVSGYGELL